MKKHRWRNWDRGVWRNFLGCLPLVVMFELVLGTQSILHILGVGVVGLLLAFAWFCARCDKWAYNDKRAQLEQDDWWHDLHG